MGTGPQSKNAESLTRQDRLQIALALHTPVERDTQTFTYRDLSEEELGQQADLLVQAFRARTLFLDGEILTKEGFAQAVREQYATIYRGTVAAHQLLEQITNEPGQEEVRRFEDDFVPHLRGDYYEESLIARKNWLSLLLNIAENLTHSPSASGSDLFAALAEAILDYQRRYPKMSAAMQGYLQNWLRHD
jgi:hypothetical protein